MDQEKIKELVAGMTLEEKAGLCSGADFWHTKAIERLGIPAVMVSDGPVGLRKQEIKGDHMGMGGSIPAVCFPSGVLSAASFDRELLTYQGEIYLASFENAVKKAKPWTIMGAYNRVNGVFATEHEEYLTKVLRDEWGFDGYAMTDWGAVHDRVQGLKAGLDLEMPGSNGVNDRKIVAAVQNGELDEAVLDRACERFLDVCYRYLEHRDESAVFDREKDHAASRTIAEESMVLLKNEGILPLRAEEKLAFIGHYAKTPRYQGGGSSHINSSKVVSILEAAKGKKNIRFAQGFDDSVDEPEGFDREHMQLPACQNELIDAVCEVQKNVVVVLHNGAPVEMPWVHQVKGILESYLAGQAVGEAQYRVLFGEVNPSGRLAETFPVRLEDNPTYFYYGKDGDEVEYQEGVLVGYRYYDAKKLPVLFPFGHGLSYTEFTYSDLKISATQMKDMDTLHVSVTVTNTGKRAGKEVVQLYVAPKDAKFFRPVRELRAFEKIVLEAGESKEINFILEKRAFSYWNTTLHDWHVESGVYEIQIGKSSREIVLTENVQVESTVTVPYIFTRNSTIGDLFARPEKMQMVMGMFRQKSGGELPYEQMDQDGTGEGANNPEMMQAMIQYMPLRSLISFNRMEEEQLEGLLAMLNREGEEE